MCVIMIRVQHIRNEYCEDGRGGDGDECCTLLVEVSLLNLKIVCRDGNKSFLRYEAMMSKKPNRQAGRSTVVGIVPDGVVFLRSLWALLFSWFLGTKKTGLIF